MATAVMSVLCFMVAVVVVVAELVSVGRGYLVDEWREQNTQGRGLIYQETPAAYTQWCIRLRTTQYCTLYTVTPQSPFRRIRVMPVSAACHPGCLPIVKQDRRVSRTAEDITIGREVFVSKGGRKRSS